MQDFLNGKTWVFADWDERILFYHVNDKQVVFLCRSHLSSYGHKHSVREILDLEIAKKKLKYILEQLKNYNYYRRTFQNKDNDLLEWEKEFSRQILQVNSAIKKSIDQSDLAEHLSYLQTAHDIYDNFMESSQYFKFLKLEAKNNFEMGIRSYVKFTKIPNFWGRHKRNLQALRQEQQDIVKNIGEELTLTNEKLEKWNKEINALQTENKDLKTENEDLKFNLRRFHQQINGLHEIHKTLKEDYSQMFSETSDNLRNFTKKIETKFQEAIEKIRYKAEEYIWMLENDKTELRVKLDKYKRKYRSQKSISEAPKTLSFDQGTEFTCKNFHEINRVYPFLCDTKSGGTLTFNLGGGQTYYDAMEILTKYRFKDIHKIHFKDVPDKNKIISKFLSEWVVGEIQYFDFSFKEIKSDFEWYLPSLTDVSSNITNGISFKNCNWDNEQLVKLFENFKHCALISLNFCTFNISQDFSFGGKMDGCKLRGLSLSYSGKQARSNWKNKPETFFYLISALGKEPGVRSSLSTLLFKECELDINIVRDTLDEQGFGHVLIRDD